MNHPGPSDELLKLLENLPPDEPRSKLEPFRAIILRWRRQGRSYRRIQEILLEQCKVEVAYETLRRFVQRRERPRAAQPDDEAPTTSAAPQRMPTAAAASVDHLRRGPRTHAPVQGAARREPASEKESL